MTCFDNIFDCLRRKLLFKVSVHITQNVTKSAYHYPQDLQEKGYYNRVVAGNINQQVQVDSVVCDFDTYPYRVTTYARQMIIRESNVTERSLVTRCNLINSVRSDNNPQGFTMERFEIVENRDLRVIAR